MQIFSMKIRTKIKIFRENLGGFTAAEGDVELKIMMRNLFILELILLSKNVGDFKVDVIVR